MDPEDPDSDPDHFQNLITFSFYIFRHILKISSKSVHKFLSYLIHKQTEGQTDKPRPKLNLFGGGNNNQTSKMKVNELIRNRNLLNAINCLGMSSYSIRTI